MITSLVITLLAWKTNKVKVESEWRAHRPLQVMGGAPPQHHHRYHFLFFFVFVIECSHTCIKKWSAEKYFHVFVCLPIFYLYICLF